ncbi:DHA2 family efflux MFS transporter permease subunit [Alkalibacterium kapii]|uniref:Multidrug transporter n=1 Tax=Alkalibacterium kapii TaxID=426704 RepID=A0A511AR11_9LACT|nr:DHA2 family efflux MFS transporter permease subunit [Alkalibacterium kapii]GEK90644.1 multidrug transporter [Alkalibacterium kapii]
MKYKSKRLKDAALKVLTNQLDLRDRNDVPISWVYTALFMGTLVVIMNQNAIKTALPQLIIDLHVSPAIGQWTISGYTLVKGIMVPITAFAMNKFRSRNLFILMMLFFGLGSIVAATGITFYIVLIGTLLQGVAAGMVIPLMQTIVLTVSPMEKRGSALGMMGVILGFGGTLGPALGGYIVDELSWQFIFWFAFIGSVLVIPLAHFTLTDVLPMSNPTLDWVSIRYSLIGFGLLLFGLSVMGSDGFESVTAWAGILIGVFFVILFIRRNLKSDEPMLNVSLFKNKTFSLAVIIAMLGLMVVTGLTNVMPMYIQSVLGRSATLSGLIILPGGLLKAFIAPLTGKLFDKYGIRVIGPLGGVIMFSGTLLLTFITEATPLWYVAVIYLFLSLGFGIFNIPVTTAGMNALPDKEMSHATPARQTVRQIGSSFSITIVFATMSIVSSLLQSQTSGTSDVSDAGSAVSIYGIQGGFILISILAFITFILTLFLKESSKKV